MTGVELEDILSELFPSDDPLDQKDFDVNQYINSLFPNEQSLNGLEDVILEMTNRIDDLDGEVSNLVREGNQNSFESENLLNQSMEEIKELVKSINTIKTRAQVGFLSSVATKFKPNIKLSFLLLKTTKGIRKNGIRNNKGHQAIRSSKEKFNFYDNDIESSAYSTRWR